MATKENEKILSLDRYLELKEQGFEFEGQSYLFWEYMRILTELRKHNPDIKFLLENVKMKKEWERVLTEAIGVPGVHINSALVSAQNRKRIYWTNIGNIEQPEDRGLLLRDVLQSEVNDKYFLKEEVVKKLVEHRERHKAKRNGFGAVFHKGEQKMASLKVGGHSFGDLVQHNDYLKISRKGQVRQDQDKASCLTIGGHGCGNHSDMDLICVAMRGRPQGENNEQQLEPSPDEGKTNCLTTVAKDNLLLSNEPRIRRLTPTECARLQTIPEWYKWECSETQQYRMLGNGWTVEVIKHIFSYL
jgi:DNA (cytosine-5)-methyltransferase 3A